MTIPGPPDLPRPLPKVEITDNEEFGRLVQKWANGDLLVPQNIETFKEQVSKEGLTVKIPKNMVNFLPVQIPSNTLMLVIPSLDAIAKCEDYLLNRLDKSNIYPVDEYYKTAFEVDGSGSTLKYKEMSKSQRETFMMQRIGEYCVNVCM